MGYLPWRTNRGGDRDRTRESLSDYYEVQGSGSELIELGQHVVQPSSYAMANGTE